MLTTENSGMTTQQIITDLNGLYEEIRSMIPIYGNSITGSVISDISLKVSKAIARIEKAEHERLKQMLVK
jgi:hypothetical protein